MEIHPLGDILLHSDGWTGRPTDMTQFCEGA